MPQEKLDIQYEKLKREMFSKSNNTVESGECSNCNTCAYCAFCIR